MDKLEMFVIGMIFVDGLALGALAAAWILRREDVAQGREW